MSVVIGSARIDERGKARGGSAGDQTGKEVGTQTWYLHPKGWRVLRCIDREKAAKIAEAMRSACANPYIGYDQGQRLTLYDAAAEYGFDPSKVKKKVETDCSALVRVCLAYAGIKVGNFRTPTEAKVLLATGLFVERPEAADNPGYVCAGDILVTKTQGHTVVALSDGGLVNHLDEDGDGYIEVTALGAWRVRAKPSILGKRVGAVSTGCVLRYYGRKGEWAAISGGGMKGWVNTKAFGG